MFDQVHFTGTINLGAVVSSLLTLIGVLIAYYRLKIEFMRGQNAQNTKIDAQTARLETCIHQMPGHPESSPPTPQNVDNSVDNSVETK